MKVKGWEKICHPYSTQKEAGRTILMTTKIDLRQKIVTIDKEGHYIMLKELIRKM